jgi:vitamin B12 transporter
LAGDSFDNASNTVRLDGYSLAHLRAAFPVGDRFELYGRVENVFDTDYVQVAGYNSYGRNAHVGVRATF